MFLTRACRSWLSKTLYHRPWPPSPAIAPLLDSAELIEEEESPNYHPDRFYPASLGQVLNRRYQIATKLGHGASSTVWLARDLRWRWSKERYVAVKINASKHHSSRKNAGKNELAFLKRLSRANPKHHGWHFTRHLLDSFTVEGVSGEHQCLVLEPLREPLWIYCRRFIGEVIPSNILKIMLRMILLSLDYLHSECQIIHTDLKLDNILVKLEDPVLLEWAARDEYDNPLPQKHVDKRTIYLSRNDFGRLLSGAGIPIICDFDISVSGSVPQSGGIQADMYRAPEAILDAGYTYSADIWNLGVLLWALLEGKELFHAADRTPESDFDEHSHLAYITALLGHPPQKLLDAGRRTSLFYRPDGGFKTPALIPQGFSFESSINQIDGEDKKMFIEFVKRMIKWSPHERSTAIELFRDPWLYADFPST